ncbi:MULTISPECIES: hypothetical protein [unclassified Microbacterium]|uniref:hypothetical protein n=1 Tax=unclassified Microbacterium TaxID=2609290 RepID=UPI000EA9B6CC|nr:MULTISPECIES: hypothetical protein [unclassified Microbacterium]MBT2486193.1 hypothetical protein [Microbacterium sp. ISL-108]RKN68917.1 hypothetical protein D7252_15925 [Microbacterium sp. CGR2]
MSENPGQAPAHIIQNNRPPSGKSAAGKGVIALVLCAAAFLSAPMLILIPYVGFVPAVLAGAAIIVAWSGLRGATHGNGTAVTGLIIGVVLFAVFAGIATVWNLVVADPAIRDYDQLHEVIEHIKGLVFGS